MQVWLSDSSVKALATFATGRPIRWPAIALLLLFGWFSLCATHDYLAWNRARWRAWDWLSETRGATIQQVDGGYELNGWLNYYDRDPATVADDRSFWWVTDDRYIIAFGYVPGYERIHRETFARWLWWSRGEVGVWERE